MAEDERDERTKRLEKLLGRSLSDRQLSRLYALDRMQHGESGALELAERRDEELSKTRERNWR